MQEFRSCKIRIEATNKQRTMFNRHAGCARYAYNWAIEIQQKVYLEAGERVSGYDLNKMFVRLEKSKHLWLNEVSKCCTQKAILNFDVALKRFFSLRKNGENKTGKLQGLPQKKKKFVRDSFYLERDGILFFQVNGTRVKLPKIGWVKCSEKLPEGIQIKNCVIRRVADEWFISFKQEFTPIKHENQVRVGVDLGIKKLATCSNGVVFESPRKYKLLQKRLARAQRSLSRKYEVYKKTKVISANYRKQKLVISKFHATIANHRADGLHKATSYLTRNFGTIVIEDLNVSGMLKNGNLAKHIANGSFYEFRRQLEYKARWYGAEIVVADRFFASSKICSGCGEKKKDLKLSDRIWTCEVCDKTHDRDTNAAINLENYPKFFKEKDASSFGVKACGAWSSADFSVQPREKILRGKGSKKQTLNPRE